MNKRNKSLVNNVILVVNPVSGGLDKSAIIEAVAFFAAKENKNFVLYETSGVNDIFKIRKLYKTYIPKRIIIAGGDGTINMVAEAMQDEDVIIGILPAGSANGLAVDLNLPESIDENLEICFHNNFLAIDMILINDKISFHLSDLGLNADLVKNYEKSEIRGKWGYVLQAYTTLKDLEEPFTATITANGETMKCIARMIVIANSQKYGTGIVINPNGLMNDGRFELIILKNLDLLVLAKIITGNMPIDSEDLAIISTNKAIITTNVPVSFQMDGEYCGTETLLNISVMPQRMKVSIPKF
jgi:diacylglycerol kinase (ATP)